MGGGSPSHSGGEEDEPWVGYRDGNWSPWPPLVPGLGVKSSHLETSSEEEVPPATGVSALANGDGTIFTNGSPGPGPDTTTVSVESEARRCSVDALESGDLDVIRRHEMNGRENCAVSEFQFQKDFNTPTEEIVQDILLSAKESIDLQNSSVAPSTRPASPIPSGSFKPAQKGIFKLMQIENDSQDLSFVEKVLLSHDETFSLCNDITAGSAKASEGRRIIDFGSLNSKSMKVVGFFGCKDVMREIFQETKFTEQFDVWMQIQNDTLAPGLYAWLHSNSLFVFYWHQGHSLPTATRKDMSCNFIRYIFDLCDTVCVCLEGKNLKNSLFESAPKFSKRQRTQRLQISLVKASEDSVKVTPGFSLQNLPLGCGNALPGIMTRAEEKASLNLIFGHDYKLSEGHSRIALLVSSTRPRKLSSLMRKEEMTLDAFPAFIYKWTVDGDYSLDLRSLPDADFLVFIHSANLQQADDLDKLVESNAKRKEEEGKKMYTVDQLVEEQQELLSRHLESFINAFLSTRYPWEEKLMLLNSSAHHPVTPDPILAASDDSQIRNSGEVATDVNFDSSVNLSGALDRMTSESRLLHTKKAHEVSPNDLDQHEMDIYSLLLDGNSKQRMVFPTSAYYIYYPATCRYCTNGGSVQRRVNTIAPTEPNENVSSKLAPIFHGNKVTLTCINDSSVPPKIRILRLHNAADYEGPILTDEKLVCIEEGRPEKIIMLKRVGMIGDLREWLTKQAAQLEFPNLCKSAVLLTSIFQKFSDSRAPSPILDAIFDETLVRNILASKCPLEQLEPALPEQVLEFARSKWEELPDLSAKDFRENFQMTIAEGVQYFCVDMFKGFRDSFHSKISTQIERYSASLLLRKIRKQCSENYESFEAALKEEELAFIASQKDHLSRRKDSTGSLMLTVEACNLIERSTGWRTYVPFIKTKDDGQKVSIRYTRQEFEKESITWHGLELAPMKEDLDQLLIDNEHAFSPCWSGSKEIIDLDPSSQTLLRAVFLKAGQLLVFIIEVQNDQETLLIYVCPKLAVKLSVTNIIQRLKRGFDLIAFDERSRFIAFYDSVILTIKTYRFDETFRHMDWTGVDIALGEYANIGRLVWMDFVTGRNEIVFIDDLHRVRVCEVSQPGMVRSGNVHVGNAPIVKACVTLQGPFLLLLRKVNSIEPVTGVDVREQATEPEPGSESESEGLDTESTRDSVHPATDRTDTEDGMAATVDLVEHRYTMDVYKLGDSIQQFSSIELDMKIKDLSKLEVGLVSFSSQMHLVIFDSTSPSVLTSKVIKISSSSEVCQLQQITRPEEGADQKKISGATTSGPVLDYIYEIFDKYATSPPLSRQSRDLQLHMLLKGPLASDSATCLSDKCLQYVKTSIDRLQREKGKDFSAVKIHPSVHDANRFLSCIALPPWSIDAVYRSIPSVGLEVRMGAWMRKLVCLVPIQIARAEHNALKPMVDGLQLSGNVDYVDAISLANVIRFGLYEAVFDSWTGPVKVISSMGKQSSGKSYLLNHLSGSLLDVAGGRCTDGVWMTLREEDGCLYVLLDFEGLGSFERSEQEDMLLSILNAAISNLTIFNKKDFHLDKETEVIFERFQNGVSLVKTDAKLFRGLFYMAIKDVDSSDVEDLKKEFFSKISQICSKSQDNFLTRMYGGSVEISAMPSFNRPEFHESIADIAFTIEEIEASYTSGRSFLLDLKLIIAQISTKDWSSIDSKRVALRINLLRKHLKSAISVGCFFSDGMPNPLIQFDDHVAISDEPLTVDEIDFPICDRELELTAFQEKKVTGDIILTLMATFKSIMSRKGDNDEEWHSSFEKFITALVLRRKSRVLQWIAFNTSEFSNDGDIQKLQLEAVAMLAEVQQNLLLCSCKCERCFLRCVQKKGHPSDHSCRGDHRCVALCSYCLDEGSSLGAGPCNDAAGHGGSHDCHEKSHTCGSRCTYVEISSNCNESCSKKSGHTGDHICNSRLHTCNEVCSLPSCKNPCVSPIDLGDHEIHACHEKFCPLRCTIDGCNRTCAVNDHFHGTNPEVEHHFCGSDHPCTANCEHSGNFEVLTEVSKRTQTFTGRRATFDYVLVSEQNGNRKGCCIVIPPNKYRHEGPHSHSSNPDAVHFCETRCPSCGYFCTRPMEHGGLHSTTHGNMRGVNFVAESEEIDILDRKYAWGESGVAEMCQMHCKAQGRGHSHLIHCPANNSDGTCRRLFDGAQHELRKYGPDFDVPKDEMTHSAFWEYMRFDDPCNAEEQKQFALCNHQCRSEEHQSGGTTSSAVLTISYCTESLWHPPIPKTDLVQFGTGYITDDGHHFNCDHSTNVAVNVIFIIDRSGSMDHQDIRPTMTKFSRHDNRLGCVYEAILRFIRTRLSSVREDIASVILFNDAATTVISLQEMKESLVDELLNHYASGGTYYSTGLQSAEHVLSLATQDARLSRQSPVIIFLSDGGNSGGGDPLHHIYAMKALDPRLQLHTIMFGKHPSRKILEDMAKAGDGTFEVSINEVQLSRRFEGLARSLRPQVASLL